MNTSSTSNTFVDLFCGCGGFSLGANLAGYKNILSVDIDKTLTSSYKLNFPNSNLVLSDLSSIENIRTLLPEKSQKPSLLIGGPPCQGFSFIGKRNQDDPRNNLVFHFFRHVKDLKPHVFIFENVKGIISGYGLDIISKSQSQLPGYFVMSNPIEVNAYDFGAATSRPRILIIGYDKRYADKPNIDQILKLNINMANVKDAIEDLPAPIKSNETDFQWSQYKNDVEPSDYVKRLKRLPPKNLGHLGAIENLKQSKVSGQISTIHSADVKLRFKQTKQGQVESISRFYKLKWDIPSRTIRAGTGRDKGGFQSARPIHPSQSRVITIREAARLQGFPDWFLFHPTKWHSFRMIGNSVSPIMGHELIKRITNFH